MKNLFYYPGQRIKNRGVRTRAKFLVHPGFETFALATTPPELIS